MFQKAEIDAVYLVGNNFKSMMASLLVTTRLLPVELPEKQEQIDYIFEQPPGELLAALLPRYIEAQIYRSMLESDAAQHAARMTAMEAASSNASDVISALTLKMNRVRQASITREIIEIVSGAARFGVNRGIYGNYNRDAGGRQSHPGGRSGYRHSVPRAPDSRSSTRPSTSPAKASIPASPST